MFTADIALPVVFMGLMGLAMLIYVVLDGYDLGVGMLMPWADDEAKDLMIASIGPFWDANETWLVLGVGLLLVAFPAAHGVVLGALYLPIAFMLIGLMLRGVAFDFRVKVHARHKHLWNQAFFVGSLLTSLSQGTMLGLYITGFDYAWPKLIFALMVGLGLCAGYILLGACWLILKTEGGLQRLAISWARHAVWLTGLGIAAVSIATPLLSTRIFERWFALPNVFLLLPIPLFTLALFVVLWILLPRLPRAQDAWSWTPFACVVGIFILAFYGLAYSLFPYLVAERMTVWQAASSTDALWMIFWGTIVVLPAILGYTLYAYYVFRGKAALLTYG